MMELAAARAAMEEQTARREALRGEGGGEGESADGVSGVAAAGSYNKAGLLQKAAEMSRNIAWEETLTVGDVPLELEDVHDDLKRYVKILLLGGFRPYDGTLEILETSSTVFNVIRLLWCVASAHRRPSQIYIFLMELV